ncbi:MAG: hypothetical protein WC637_00095 [Victivallales bacterium]|jgi:hypothetical protein
MRLKRYVNHYFVRDVERGFEWITPFVKVVIWIGGFYAAYVVYLVFLKG